jgi:pyridoxine kinase
VHFDAIYTGYLASAEQIGDVCAFFDMLTAEDTMIFVDPAMADHGKLYPGFGPEFPAEMAKVAARADVLIPNLTEACLLTGAEYKEEYDEAYIKDLLHRLVALGAKKAILTGVSFEAGKVGVMTYDSATGEYFTYFNEKLPVSFHGTGDIFSSVVMGGLMRDLSLEDALKLAVDYTLECIRITDKEETWYGVEFERVIPMLCERLKDVK